MEALIVPVRAPLVESSAHYSRSTAGQFIKEPLRPFRKNAELVHCERIVAGAARAGLYEVGQHLIRNLPPLGLCRPETQPVNDMLAVSLNHTLLPHRRRSQKEVAQPALHG